MPSSPSRQSAVLPPHLARQREETFHMDGPEGDDGDGLVIPSDSLSSKGEDLEERVQTTQTRLAQLRVEAEALEREKLQFEELSRQQKEFMHGRAEMGEKLARALSHLDRETYEAQKRVEQLLLIKDTFNHHLDVMDSLNPEQWNPHDLRHDLSRALGMIEDARDEYIGCSARIQQLTMGAVPAGNPNSGAHSPAPAASTARDAHFNNHRAASMTPGTFGPETFRHWLFCGLAFTTPVIGTALLGFLLWLLFR